MATCRGEDSGLEGSDLTLQCASLLPVVPLTVVNLTGQMRCKCETLG